MRIRTQIFILLALFSASYTYSSFLTLPAPFLRWASHSTANHWDYLRTHFTWHTMAAKAPVQKQLAWLSQHPSYMTEITKRGSPYLFYISHEVYKRHLPAELALLPIIESAFDPQARSSAGATGLWQLIASTAKAQGIALKPWYDGRKDVISSTRAALDHLESLYDEFDQNWLLAIAAYNSGSGTVKKAMLRNLKLGKSTAFWDLDLPPETKAYIPKLIALTEVIRKPERYQQTLPLLPHRPYFDSLQLPSKMDLKTAAQLSDLSVETLYALNSGIHPMIQKAPLGTHFSLILPNEKSQAFRKRLASIPEGLEIQWQRYKIQKGDTIEGISRKFKTLPEMICTLNDHPKALYIGQELVIPKGAYPSSTTLNLQSPFDAPIKPPS
jgi:membrane-bound lytic murein transglycosylase D